ncbi:hypothetical protein PFISCL1PPCAC_4014 [Pristionchus fissidentatus]|uniref:Lipid scramblase CLPTM1L n=1 Tax=Pristionchus fissidentatus TaxID=1538716 RepID=A0AAV5V306_9BILA|nr:hypothetical protein PFISCL1PPCAC_4014 [Pristionchus fissidentatus]
MDSVDYVNNYPISIIPSTIIPFFRSGLAMGWFSLGTLTGLAFLFYAGHTMNYFYTLFHPPLCGDEGETRCIEPLIAPSSSFQWPLLQLRVYAGVREHSMALVHTFRHFDVGKEFEKEVTFDLPKQTRANGTLMAKVILLPADFNEEKPSMARWYVEDTVSLSQWKAPAVESFNLMGEEKKAGEKKSTERPVTHIKSVLPIRFCDQAVAFAVKNIPIEFRHMIQTQQVKGGSHKYLPLMRIEHLSMRTKHLNQVKPSNDTTTVLVSYSPSSIGKMRLFISTEVSLNNLLQLHLTEDDLDEVKGIFVDTNPLLLSLTILVSALHLCFDFLAFKNDISFWRNKKSMEGLSTKTLIWRAVSSTIVFFYLMEHKTSMLVLVPSGLTVLIEYWKVGKALKVSFSFRGGFQLGAQSQEEVETDSIDSQAMYYLTALLIPLCLGGAVYSLLYMPHRSWKSWILETAANGVYAFGFLFMLPQLFVNYKLKSVAHLPWRAFMYKAFNTFIDDLFAFIITMPTAHRVACFRDDIVFLVYLYQRWLYPVDKSRVNEYGEDFVEEEKPLEKTSEEKKKD